MNSQQLLYLNLILGVVFLLYFLLGRPQPKAPTRLNLKNKSPSPSNETATPFPVMNEAQIESQKKQHISQASLTSKMTVLEPETENPRGEFSAAGTPKNLAIFFIYNGHDWEAHSVLGVAQGAHLKTVTEHYQKMLESSAPDSYDFLEAAYKAILKRKRRDVL